MALRRGRRTRWVLSAAILGTLVQVSSATAVSNGVHRFAIKAKPVTAALIDFALQSNVSIGGDFHCPELAAPIEGAMTLEAGLTKLLAHTSCDFRRVAPDAILIFERVRPRPRSSPSPHPIRPTPTAPAAPTNDQAVSEIIISATKRRALADQLPYAVSLISAQTLNEIGAVDTYGIVAGQPTVTSTNLGPGLDKVLLRGLSDGAFTGRTQSTVGLFLDNTPITYNAPDPDLRLTDVQSVEILRGPQGSLYGGGSMSGVYRIVTRQPALNTLSENIMVGGGLTEKGAASSEAEGMINIPLARDVAALRLVGYNEYDGGYIDNTGLKASNVDSSRRWGGRATLRLLAPNDWTITTGGAYQAIHTNDTQYVDATQGKLHHDNKIDQNSSNTFAQAYVMFDHEGPAGDFRSSTSFVNRSLTSRTDASNALYIFAVSGTGSTDGVGAFDEPIKIDTVVEDAVLSSPNVGRWRWLVGLYGSLTRENTQSIVRTGQLNSRGLSLVLYDEQRYDRLTETAIYGETSYDLTNRLTFTGGLRVSDTAVDTNSTRSAPQNRNRKQSFSGDATFDAVSPKLALNYRFSANNSAYLLLSNGQRAGGFNTGGFFGTGFLNIPIGNGINQVNRRFSSDELWNTEGGIKTSIFNKTLDFSTSAFYVDWRKVQTDQYLQNEGISYTVNAGDGHDIGIEFDTTWRPTSHFLFELNGLFDRPRLTRPARGFVTPGVTAVLPGVPDVTLGARTSYQWSLGANLAALISAQAEYIGHSHITFDPTKSPDMGGYVLGKISGQLETPHWRLAVYLINPTNESGNTFSYGNPFTVGAITQTTPQRPRTLRVTLSAGF